MTTRSRDQMYPALQPEVVDRVRYSGLLNTKTVEEPSVEFGGYADV
jgi:hypothetical protein